MAIALDEYGRLTEYLIRPGGEIIHSWPAVSGSTESLPVMTCEISVRDVPEAVFGHCIVAINERRLESPIPIRIGDTVLCISQPGCVGVFLNGEKIG